MRSQCQRKWFAAEVGLDFGQRRSDLSTSGHTSVDRAESKTKEAIVVFILLELVTDLISKLNSLSRDSSSSNVDSVFVNIAARARSISVGDIPGCTLEFPGCARLGWVVETVTRLLRSRELGREDPTVEVSTCAAAKENQRTDLQSLYQSPNSMSDLQWSQAIDIRRRTVLGLLPQSRRLLPLLPHLSARVHYISCMPWTLGLDQAGMAWRCSG